MTALPSPYIIPGIEPASSKLFSVEDVVSIVCERMEVTLDQLKLRSRKEGLVKRRQVLAYYLIKRAGLNLTTAGKLLGYDHTTILAGQETLKALCETEYPFAQWVAAIDPARVGSRTPVCPLRSDELPLSPVPSLGGSL